MSKKNLKDLLDSMNQGIKASTGKEEDETPVTQAPSNVALRNPYVAAPTTPVTPQTDTAVNNDTMTYEEWEKYKRDEAMAEAARQYDITAQYADQQRQNAYYDAGVAEQKAILDANNAYARNRSTYGAQAESLGRNGLAMSGYSDYGNQVAYATSRAEIAAAGANRGLAERQAEDTYASLLLGSDAQRGNAELNAKLTYADNMSKYQQQVDQQKAQNYEAIYESIMGDLGSYSSEQIQSFADAGYISQEQANAIQKGKAAYDVAATDYLKSIDSLLESLPQYSNPDETLNQIGSTIDGAYTEGQISKDVYQQIYAKLVLKKIQNADENNLQDIKDTLAGFREEGKLSSQGYADALSTLHSSITERLGGYTIESVEDRQKVMDVLRNSNAIAGKTWSIGEEMNNLLKEYVGDETWMVAHFNGETYIHYNKQWRKANGQVKKVIDSLGSK